MSHKTRPQTRPGKARPDIAWLPHLPKSSQPSGARLAAAYYRITARASVTTLAIETFEMDDTRERWRTDGLPPHSVEGTVSTAQIKPRHVTALERQESRRPTGQRLPVCPGDAALWRRRRAGQRYR